MRTPDFVGHVKCELDALELQNFRMNAEKNRVFDTTILAGCVFHRMIVFEAQVHILIQALQLISFVTPVVATRSRNLDLQLPQFG